MDQGVGIPSEPEVVTGRYFSTEPHLTSTVHIPLEPQPDQSLFVVPEPQAKGTVFVTHEVGSQIPSEPQPPPEPSVPPVTPNENYFKVLFNSLLMDDTEREIEVEDGAQLHHEPVDAKQPLYRDAPLSLHESFVSILSLALTHKLTGVCLKAILDLISIHLPPVNNFRTSLEFFKKYFSYLQGPTSIEYYCSVCFRKLDSKSRCDVCSNSKVCYLIKISMEHQLQTLRWFLFKT